MWDQARLDGVVFDVFDQIRKLIGADPVIERLILPESCSSAIQNSIGYATGSPLQPLHDGRKFAMRLKNHVDVIGHDYPRVELVELPNALAI